MTIQPSKYDQFASIVERSIAIEKQYRRGVITPGEYFQSIGAQLMEYEHLLPDNAEVCKMSMDLYTVLSQHIPA